MTVMNREHTISSLLHTIEFTALKNVKKEQLDTSTVSHVTSDSRDVTGKTMFVALEGVGVDGHSFIPHAVGCGATVVVGVRGRLDSFAREYSQVLFVEVENSYESYAVIAANLFGHPGREMTLAAVTGTNGKTTVTYIVEDIFKKAGKSVGAVYDAVCKAMATLNKSASEAMQVVGVNACTDISGFGLLGHAYEMAHSSNMRLRIKASSVPLFKDVLKWLEEGYIPGGTRANASYLDDKVTFSDNIGE